jgi:hypothetical protein
VCACAPKSLRTQHRKSRLDDGLAKRPVSGRSAPGFPTRHPRHPTASIPTLISLPVVNHPRAALLNTTTTTTITTANPRCHPAQRWRQWNAELSASHILSNNEGVITDQVRSPARSATSRNAHAHQHLRSSVHRSKNSSRYARDPASLASLLAAPVPH